MTWQSRHHRGGRSGVLPAARAAWPRPRSATGRAGSCWSSGPPAGRPTTELDMPARAVVIEVVRQRGERSVDVRPPVQRPFYGRGGYDLGRFSGLRPRDRLASTCR